MPYAGRFASIFVVLLLLGFGATASHADGSRTSAEKAALFVHDFGTRVVALLAGDTSDAGKRREQIEALIRESVDLSAIGRSSIGAAWQRATPAQQQDYQELFAAWAASTYAERLGANQGGSLTVLGSQSTAADAFVRTKIARADGRFSIMDLRVRETQGRMRIVDAEVDGISMDMTQRDEFASVVRRQGLDALIASLRIQVQKLRPVAAN